MENHPIMFVMLAIVGVFKLAWFTVKIVYLILVATYKLISRIINKKVGVNNVTNR